MSTEQNDEPLTYPRIKHRLATLIEVTAMPLFGIEQAKELVKNIHDDLITIQASLAQLNEKSPK